MQICYVALALRSQFHNQLFAYCDPTGDIQVGDSVDVPFGKKIIHGFVLQVSEVVESEFAIKDIIGKRTTTPALTREMIAIIQWLVDSKFAYYFDAINLFLSPRAKFAQTKATLQQEKQYILALSNDVQFSKNAKKQSYVYEGLKQEILPLDLDDAKKRYGWEYLKKLVEKAYIVVGPKAAETLMIQKPQLTLTAEQKAILTALQATQAYAVHLLQGATGSGKTEVYLHYLETLIEEGKQAIVLVPEIALTYQTKELFERRFGSEQIAWMHSQLTQKERAYAWEQIASEKAKIVIGTRTAIFAPVQKLGAIIIDEEHDAAYKQENQPVYHVRDIAMIRAKLNDVPLVLLSATPSVESYAQAMVGNYQHHILKKQATGQKHATIQIVDMKKDVARLSGKMLSQPLIDAIKARLEQQEQIILLLNKRGYSQSIQCRECGQTEVCPTCGVPLVLHKHPNVLQCHYCQYKKADTGVCSHCHSNLRVDIQQGIQKLEEELQTLFANIRVLRMDRDTTQKKGNTETILQAFNQQAADILIGTQMIAKGFDFPNVTLAAAINADTGLNVPNFRARERQYQLLKQLIGRAGRHKDGVALIQTYQSENPFFAELVADDDQFYKEELAIRKMYGYPPYKKQLLISVYGKSNDRLIRSLRFIETSARKQLKQCEILGPTRGYLNEINGHYYGHITIKYTKKEHLQQIKAIIDQTHQKKYNMQIVLNVDPYQTN